MNKPNTRSMKRLKANDGPRPVSALGGSRSGARRAPHAPDPTKAAEVPDFEAQTSAFELASKHFAAGEFLKASESFMKAEAGPLLEVAHSARLHARMCEQRLARPADSLRTAEDHYNYAVTLINAGQLQQAEQHLEHALAQSPRGDHLYYALALARALSGDLQGASNHLKRAIELNPRNRTTARNDPDFADVGQRSPLRELLHPERAQTG